MKSLLMVAAAAGASAVAAADANAIPLVLFLLFINRIKSVQNIKKTSEEKRKQKRVREKYYEN